MSDLFGNTLSLPGRISPGEFMLKSGELGVHYGNLFNQAYQAAADRKMKSDHGAWPKPRDGKIQGQQVSEPTPGNFDGGGGGVWDSQFGQGIDIPG